MARPPKAMESIDKNELEKLMKLYPSRQEACDWFGVSESSLMRFIKTNYGISFDSLRAKNFLHTKIAIKRKQIEKALSGDNTMLIWVGKQYLKQSENPMPEEEDHDLVTEYTRDEPNSNQK